MTQSMSRLAERRCVVNATSPEIWIDPSLEEPLCRSSQKCQRHDSNDQKICVDGRDCSIQRWRGQSADADHRAGHGGHCYNVGKSAMNDQAKIHQAMTNNRVADHHYKE